MNFYLIASKYLLVEIEGGYGTKAETPELRAYPSCKTLEFITSVIRNPYEIKFMIFIKIHKLSIIVVYFKGFSIAKMVNFILTKVMYVMEMRTVLMEEMRKTVVSLYLLRAFNNVD